jgi:hypothetical protein
MADKHSTLHYPYRRINGHKHALHRIRAEATLGKPLPPKAVVHHADGSMNVDAPLVICQDQCYHMLLHARLEAFRVCGNPDWRPCSYCRRHDDISRMKKLHHGKTCYFRHRECHNKYEAERKRSK